MAGNPKIDQGTLNRIKGSVTFSSNSALNVTSPYLGRDGISINLEGNTAEYYDTMTGGVISPQVYQPVTVTMELLKTQALSNTYKSTIENASSVGDIIVYPDSSTLGSYPIVNCTIMSVGSMAMNGSSPSFRVTLRGYYEINSSLF